MFWPPSSWPSLDTVTKSRADAYEKNLRQLIADLRKDLGDEGLPFIVGDLAEFYGTSKDHNKPDRVARIKQVRSVLRKIPQEVKHSGFVGTEGLSSLDKHMVHFDRKSYIILGRRYAKVFDEVSTSNGKRNSGLPGAA